MQSHWFLSQFYLDAALSIRVPVCTAYGGKWLCPTGPATDDGWALVQMLSTPMQMEAATADGRVVVCPYLFDPSTVPASVTTAYAEWGATAGMSLGALLAKLSETEPLFSRPLDLR